MRLTFPEYYPYTEDQLRTLWSEAIISLDANVLLGAYRRSPQTRGELTRVLRELQAQLWCTNQAAEEWQRNRLRVLQQQLQPYKNALGLVAGLRSTLEASRSGAFLPQAARDKQLDGLSALQRDLEDAQREHEDLLDDDPWFREVTSLLSGRVGPPYAEDELLARVAEGARRYAAKIPPGYCDAENDNKKPERLRAGDFILWSQLMDYASAKNRSVIFVTDDEKEDWRVEANGRKKGPRVELIREMRARAGVTFWLYDSQHFIEQARTYTKVSISNHAVDELRLAHIDGRSFDGSIIRLTDKGFGFISVDALGKDVFFHSSALVAASYDELRVGDRVRLVVEGSDKRIRAASVERA